MIRLTVSDVVVQVFAGMVALLVVSGVVVVLALGARAGAGRTGSVGGSGHQRR